jgi:hypothetical protein
MLGMAQFAQFTKRLKVDEFFNRNQPTKQGVV